MYEYGLFNLSSARQVYAIVYSSSFNIRLFVLSPQALYLALLRERSLFLIESRPVLSRWPSLNEPLNIGAFSLFFCVQGLRIVVPPPPGKASLVETLRARKLAVLDEEEDDDEGVDNDEEGNNGEDDDPERTC